MRARMSKGFAFVVVVAIVVTLAMYLDTAQAGGTQTGTWQGRSDSFAGVVIDQSGDSRTDAPDMGKMVPNVTPPSFATAYDCAGAFSGGASIAGFGGSAGGTKESEECNRRADAAYAAKLHGHIQAREIMCASKRYYLGNKRAGLVYASVKRPYVDKDGMPLACYPNAEYDADHKDEQVSQRKRAADPHRGAIPSSWSDD